VSPWTEAIPEAAAELALDLGGEPTGAPIIPPFLPALECDVIPNMMIQNKP